MPSYVQEDRVVTLDAEARQRATVTVRICYVGQDRPRVLLFWCPALRARGHRLSDRKDLVAKLAWDVHRSTGLDLDATRLVEALGDDRFAVTECDGEGPGGRPTLGSYFLAHRYDIERWVGGELAPIPLTPG
ncbi:hypothetical protein AB1L88_15470 [Tautonia sp. JC769]|uniref:hypothetical protein n=1 Tax=Tautonia sp. JC769 TaxID=3232135 RepID=UPI003458142B